MARAAREHLKLDKILFMPTGSPRYRTPAVASGEQRVAMLRLALEGNDSFEIDARELAPGASMAQNVFSPSTFGFAPLIT